MKIEWRGGRRRTTALWLVTALASSTVAGCASGGSVRDPSVLEREIGRVAYQDVRMSVDKILSTKYAYPIRRFEENYNTLYFETDWIPRDAEADEANRGIQRVRTRIILTGRRGSQDVFRIQFRGESEYLVDGQWQRLPLQSPQRDKLQRILTDLDMEMRSGVRTR